MIVRAPEIRVSFFHIGVVLSYHCGPVSAFACHTEKVVYVAGIFDIVVGVRAGSFGITACDERYPCRTAGRTWRIGMVEPCTVVGDAVCKRCQIQRKALPCREVRPLLVRNDDYEIGPAVPVSALLCGGF